MTDFVLPETRYALSGDVSIAYQTMGKGPIDIILVPGVVSHIEFLHELPGYTAFLRRLSNFAQVVTFDKRGQDCLTECRALHLSNNVWTTFAPLWTRSTHRAPFCSGSQKVVQ